MAIVTKSLTKFPRIVSLGTSKFTAICEEDAQQIIPAHPTEQENVAFSPLAELGVRGAEILAHVYHIPLNIGFVGCVTRMVKYHGSLN